VCKAVGAAKLILTRLERATRGEILTTRDRTVRRTQIMKRS
jgi:hypothetical protein